MADKPVIFLSHNHHDKAFARSIDILLINAGFKTWLDDAEINVGDSLLKRITDGVHDSDFLIAIITSNSEKSKWVLYELEKAMNLEITQGRPRVLPIVVGNAMIPNFLSGKFYLELSNQDDLKAKKNRLLKSLGVIDASDKSPSFSDLIFISDDGVARIEVYTDGIITFKKPIYKIRWKWKVHNARRGMKFTSKWYKDGVLWRDWGPDIYDGIWDTGETMSNYIENLKGHPSGSYYARLFIEDQYQCSGSFLVID